MVKLKKLSNLLSIVTFLAMSACSSFSLKLATPFKRVSEKEQFERYLVIVTYAEYNKDAKSEQRFDDLVSNVVEDIEKANGVYGYSIRKDFFGNTAWTYTIWESDQAMTSFKVSKQHLKAMNLAPEVLIRAKFAREFITPEALPYSWENALALLEKQGRLYRYTD